MAKYLIGANIPYHIWEEIEKSIEKNSMVNVYLDHIEAIK